MKIPSYEGGGSRISPTPLDPKTASTGGRMIQDIGEGLVGIAEHFEALRDSAQTTKAEANLIKVGDELENKYAHDPDLFTAPQRAEDELAKVTDDISQGITSGEARNNFKQKSTITNAHRLSSIKSMLMGRQIDVGKSNYTDFMDTSLDAYLKSHNDGERNSIFNEMSNKTNEAIQLGYVDNVAGKKMLKEYIDKARVGQAEFDINLVKNTPQWEQGLDNIQKKIDNNEYNLTGEEKLKATTKVEQAKKFARAEQKENLRILHNQNGHELWDKYNVTGLTEPEVEEKIWTNQITQKEGTMWLKKLGNPTFASKGTDPQSYIDMVKFMMDESNTTQSIREKLLEMNANGKINNDDIKKLYMMHIVPSLDARGNVNLIELDKEGVAKDEAKLRRGFLGGAVKMFSNYVKNGTPIQLQAQMTGALINILSNPQTKTEPHNIPKAANEVIKKQRLNDHPEMAGYSEDGQVVMDEDGNTSMAYPDGGSDSDDKEASDGSGY